jgi:hypothetical protein
MNAFALSAESHTWWLPSAIAGAIGAVALGAILILPTLGQPATVHDAPDYPGACFREPAPHNYGVDQLPQPVCR